MADDFYDTLGVSRDASDADIKSAYRKLAMKYHPDRNQGDATAEQKFKDVSQAYEILKEAKNDQLYLHRFNHSGFDSVASCKIAFSQDNARRMIFTKT